MRRAILAAALLAAVAAPTAADDGVRLPDAEIVVRADGSRLLLLPDPSLPLVSIHVRLPGGVVHDRAGQAGRAALLAEWVRRGAGERDAAEFRKAVESRGGRLQTYAAPRWVGLDAEFLAEDLELGLGLVRDVLDRPRFDPDELTKARDLALDGLRLLRTQPSGAVGEYWNAWLFGAHPWGHPPEGDEQSLPRVAVPEALRARWTQVARPANRWIAITGDFDAADVERLLPVAEPASPGAVPADAPPAAIRDGVLLVDHPEALQTYFRFGGPGLDRSDPDHAARVLANTVLGGRFTSRLNKTLRTEEGLTYGAGSGFDDDRGGAFAVRTYTEVATSERCMQRAAEVYDAFRSEGMTAEELDSARAYVKGQFAPDELETSPQQAAWLLDLGISGLSRDFVDGFFARLDALTLGGVNRVIRERFPGTGSWVVIGRAEALRDVVAPFGDVTEVPLSASGFGPR